MKVILEKPVIFKTIIEILGEFTKDVKLVFEKEQITIHAISTNVAFIEFKLSRKMFSKYELEGEKEEVDISLTDLKGIVSKVGPTDVFTMMVKDNQLYCVTMGKRKKVFRMGLLSEDVEIKPLDLSKFQPKNSVTLPIVDFNDTVNDFDAKITAVKIKLEEDKLIMFIDDADITTKMSIEIKKATDVKINKVEELVACKLNISYLKSIQKISRIATKLKWNLEKDTPSIFIVNVPDKFEMKYLVAPMIENE